MSIDVRKFDQGATGLVSEKEVSSPSLFAPRKFSDKKTEMFYSDFSMLIVAGMDINNALKLLTEENEHSRGLKVFGQLHQMVLTGKSLSEAMKQQGSFSSYEYRSIEIGESTGQLGDVLQLLYGHFKRKNELKGQLLRVLSYPIMIVLATAAVLVFMLNYVVPLFLNVVDEFNAELPWITKFVMNISDGLEAIYVPAGVMLAGIILLILLVRKTEGYQKIMAAIKFRIPVFGKLIQRIYLSRFCQGMHLITSSRIPLVEGLDMMENIVDDYTIRKAIPEIRQEVLQGDSLYKSLARHPIFERRMISLVRVGEEVNKLDETFIKLTDQYNKQVETRTEALKTFLEPLLMLIIGLIVGVVSLAMILPIFEISATMNV